MDDSPPLFHGLRWWVPATKARHVHAAMAVLVSLSAFAKLEGPQRVKVDDELIEIYKPWGIYPWWRFNKALSVEMAPSRAVAMRRLGMPTGMSDLTWDDVLHPWHKHDPALIYWDFQPYHANTDEALDYLRPRGLCLPEGVHFGKRWLQQASSGGTANEG